MGVSASASTLSRTGMTRLWPASSRNSSRPGLMIPRSCMAVLSACSLGGPATGSGHGILPGVRFVKLWKRRGALPFYRGRLAPVANDGVELAAVEARPGPGVAGRADLVDPDQQRIAVAVHGERLDPLHVPGGVSLAPVLLAGARIERDAPAGQGAVQRLVVHPAQHQHLVGVELLDDGGHQAGAVALEGVRQAGRKGAAADGAAIDGAAVNGAAVDGAGGGGGLLRHQIKSSASGPVAGLRTGPAA